MAICFLDPDSGTRELSLGGEAGAAIGRSVSALDRWLDSMRQTGGYGGPVVHWWRDSLYYAGPGLDWRYEGIIGGYLNLWRAAGDEAWLNKARRAADDLVAGQLPSGNFRNSCFEENPNTGGTPHEAACDGALLQLAHALKSLGDPAWSAYAEAAERNLRRYYLTQLWDSRSRTALDHPQVPSFVPNKAATLAEALFWLARATGDEGLVESYALPILDAVVACQVRGGDLDGAICQNQLRGRTIGKYLPYYIARCVPGLLAGHEWNGAQRYLDAAVSAAAFVARNRCEDGSYPQVIYGGHRVTRYPQWIAAVADILRAFDLLGPYGFRPDKGSSLAWLLAGQSPSGGFRTALGFGSRLSQARPTGDGDFRDLLPVCGWNDKVFRYLSGILPRGFRLGDSQLVLPATRQQCTLGNCRMLLAEDVAAIELLHDGRPVFSWKKAAPWTRIGSWLG